MNTHQKHRQILLIALAFLCTTPSFAVRDKKTDELVLKTMKTATRFFMDKVSYQGGFVWNYLPDFSRSWGELEARRTMVWVQPPGTPTIGNMLVDAYHTTQDNYYLKSAYRVATTLIKGQLPCGGWNYVFDLAGEDSLKTWYETIGKNAWRLEEFQHYYGNATFDDAGTIASGKFLLRLYQIEKNPKIGAALEKVIRFVLDSQYPSGGWPQRFPLMQDFTKNGQSDYTGFITLNDDVLRENLAFLTLCYQTLHRSELKAPILKAMYLCKSLQQPEPYPGWADQYTLDGKPAHARSYEPRAVNTATTVVYAGQMMDFYQVTGDTSFLSGIPAAIRFVESQKLSDSAIVLSGKRPRGSDVIVAPRFIDPDSGLPLYVHRKGTNVVNGQYYINQDIRQTIGHYSSQAFINLQELKQRLEEIKKCTPEEATKDSPFRNEWGTPPPLVNEEKSPMHDFPEFGLSTALNTLNEKGYWPMPLMSPSWPYIGAGPATGGDETQYAETMTGDKYDTSCSRERSQATCISTTMYIRNMSILIQYLLVGK